MGQESPGCSWRWLWVLCSRPRWDNAPSHTQPLLNTENLFPCWKTEILSGSLGGSRQCAHSGLRLSPLEHGPHQTWPCHSAQAESSLAGWGLSWENQTKLVSEVYSDQSLTSFFHQCGVMLPPTPESGHPGFDSVCIRSTLDSSEGNDGSKPAHSSLLPFHH